MMTYPAFIPSFSLYIFKDEWSFASVHSDVCSAIAAAPAGYTSLITTEVVRTTDNKRFQMDGSPLPPIPAGGLLRERTQAGWWAIDEDEIRPFAHHWVYVTEMTEVEGGGMFCKSLNPEPAGWEPGHPERDVLIEWAEVEEASDSGSESGSEGEPEPNGLDP